MRGASHHLFSLKTILIFAYPHFVTKYCLFIKKIGYLHFVGMMGNSLTFKQISLDKTFEEMLAPVPSQHSVMM